jgi:hypothetical protein
MVDFDKYFSAMINSPSPSIPERIIKSNAIYAIVHKWAAIKSDPELMRKALNIMKVESFEKIKQEIERLSHYNRMIIMAFNENFAFIDQYSHAISKDTVTSNSQSYQAQPSTLKRPSEASSSDSQSGFRFSSPPVGNLLISHSNPESPLAWSNDQEKMASGTMAFSQISSAPARHSVIQETIDLTSEPVSGGAVSKLQENASSSDVSGLHILLLAAEVQEAQGKDFSERSRLSESLHNSKKRIKTCEQDER